MAIGKLSSIDITAQNTNFTAYEVPSGNQATVSLNIVNRNATNANLRVALSETSTPTDDDWIEYDRVVLAAGNEPYYRPGIVLGAGQFLVVFSSQANMSAVVWGFEESTS